MANLLSRLREAIGWKSEDGERRRPTIDDENETPWTASKRDYMGRWRTGETKEKERVSARERERVERINRESDEEIKVRIERERERWKDRTDEWLCDAAMRGDVESLHEIMRIDDYILDRVLVGSFKGTNPLLVATSTGQKEFVLQLLDYKQDLAKAIDGKLGTALHIASSQGYLDIVELLAEVRPEMCLARDQEGNNPLRIAAMKGNVDVLKMLLRINPLTAQAIGDRGDNILHLCVNCNQLASLKLLLDMVGDRGFVNSTDINGNNILHLATFGRRLEIIKHLLHERPMKIISRYSSQGKLGQLIDVNARNASGWTALDIHTQVVESEDPNNQYLQDIGHVLRKYGVKRSDRLFFPFDPYWQKKKKDTLMIVSSLMATMSFQIGINPPGGVWQETKDKHDAGKAVLAYTNDKGYPYLMYLNTIGFLLSLTTILELIVVLPAQKRAFGFVRAGISWLTIMIMAFAYTFSVIAVSPMETSVDVIILVTVTVWAVLISFFRVLPHQVRGIILTFTVLILAVVAFGIGVGKYNVLLASGILLILLSLRRYFLRQKARDRWIILILAILLILALLAMAIYYDIKMALLALGILSVLLTLGRYFLRQKPRDGSRPIESIVQSTEDTAAQPIPTAVSQNDSTSVSIPE